MTKVNRANPRRQGKRRKQEQRQIINIEKLLELEDDMRKKPRRLQKRREVEDDRRGRECL
jgi:hypothetical protein